VKAAADSFGGRGGQDGENRFKYYAVKIFPRNMQEEENALVKRL
jgi:hypothetical protein